MQTFIEQAKRVGETSLGFYVRNYGTHFEVELQDTGDQETFFIGESPATYFALGVLMERYRAEQARPKRGRPKKKPAETTKVPEVPQVTHE